MNRRVHGRLNVRRGSRRLVGSTPNEGDQQTDQADQADQAEEWEHSHWVTTPDEPKSPEWLAPAPVTPNFDAKEDDSAAPEARV